MKVPLYMNWIKYSPVNSITNGHFFCNERILNLVLKTNSDILFLLFGLNQFSQFFDFYNTPNEWHLNFVSNTISTSYFRAVGKEQFPTMSRINFLTESTSSISNPGTHRPTELRLWVRVHFLCYVLLITFAAVMMHSRGDRPHKVRPQPTSWMCLQDPQI